MNKRARRQYAFRLESNQGLMANGNRAQLHLLPGGGCGARPGFLSRSLVSTGFMPPAGMMGRKNDRPGRRRTHRRGERPRCANLAGACPVRQRRALASRDHPTRHGGESPRLLVFLLAGDRGPGGWTIFVWWHSQINAGTQHHQCANEGENAWSLRAGALRKNVRRRWMGFTIADPGRIRCHIGWRSCRAPESRRSRGCPLGWSIGLVHPESWAPSPARSAAGMDARLYGERMRGDGAA
jgi:hypothetical protein